MNLFGYNPTLKFNSIIIPWYLGIYRLLWPDCIFQISQNPDEQKFQIYFGKLMQPDIECINDFILMFQNDDKNEISVLKSNRMSLQKLSKNKTTKGESEYFTRKRSRRSYIKEIGDTIVLGDDDVNKHEAPRRTLRSRNRDEICLCEDLSEEDQIQIALKRSLKGVDQSILENICNNELLTKEPEQDNLYGNIDKTIELFRYRTTHGEIVVRMEDYICLSRNEYLSDVIIDFYLHYIYNVKMTQEQRDKTLIFGTHFYTLYALSSEYSGWNDEENAGLNAKEKRYRRINGLLKNDINIFEKDFLIIPLMDNNHWFLAIVCFPKLNGSYTIDGNIKVENEEKRNPKKNLPAIKSSCILIFDSIKGNGSRRSVAINHIKHFLEYEWLKKYKDEFPFDIKNIPGHSPKVPLQLNNVDCGCFILEFMLRFFVTSPFEDYRFPLDLSNWFSSESVRLEKRREIACVILSMAAESGIELPTLRYYGDSERQKITMRNSINIDSYGNSNTENGNNNGQCFNNNNDFNWLDSNNVTLKSLNGTSLTEPIGTDKEAKSTTPILHENSPDIFDTSIDQKTDTNVDLCEKMELDEQKVFDQFCDTKEE